jgi:hypothetical protein
MNFPVRKIFRLLFISIAIIFTVIGLISICGYGVMMVVWMHAPFFEVLTLCLLFSIPLIAIVLMLKSIGLPLLQK